MLMSMRKNDKLLSVISGALVDLPSPAMLSYMWNFGSLLGIFVGVQIISGLFLALQFSGSIELSFDSVIHLTRDVNNGWLLRSIHANGASMFFLFMYVHLGRGLYYGSYRFFKVWVSGVTILLLSMATAFLGYVLPWGQMSFWAATVITNLLSAIPYLGVSMVEWVWGGFSVGNATLTRFFSFHFVLPFIIVFFVFLHLVFLHESGSGNSLGVNSDLDKVSFYPYFAYKDIFGLFVVLLGVLFGCLIYPYGFMDVENFIPSNPMVTPVHIQPEWYFLFAYTILRSISSKIGGVVALVMSIMIFYIFPFVFSHRFRSDSFYFMKKVMFWWFIVNWSLLTWIGACEVDYPFAGLGQIFSFLYFMGFVSFWSGYKFQDCLI